MITQPVLHDEQSDQMLTQANLHRMRQQWDEAMTCCMQVLYHAPDNWRAHALLGDIYADLSRPEEAIQWYCMTLDIRPESTSVREKLTRLVNAQRKTIVGAIDPARPLIDRTGRWYPGTPAGRLKWYVSAPERRRTIALGAAILGVAVIIAAPPLISARSGHGASGGVFTAGPSPTSTSLVLQPVGNGERQALPLTTQPVASAFGGAVTEAAPVTGSPAVSASTPQMRDGNDLSLASSLQGDVGLRGMGIEIGDAMIDPSSSSVTITFVSNGSPSPTAQARNLRDALNVARAAFARPEASSTATVILRCLNSTGAPSPAGAAPPAPALSLIASASRSSIGSAVGDGSAMSAAQLESLFSSLWWPPGAAPPPSS